MEHKTVELTRQEKAISLFEFIRELTAFGITPEHTMHKSVKSVKSVIDKRPGLW